MTFDELRIKVEELVDSTGGDTVRAALAEVCHEKAAHIQSAWQDDVTARPWEMLGRTLDKINTQGV